MAGEGENCFEKTLKKANFYMEDMAEAVESGEKEDIKTAYEKVCGILKKLESSITAVTEDMLDDDVDLEEVRSWSKAKKEGTTKVREFRNHLKERLAELDESEREKEYERTLEQQRVIREEQAKTNREQQKQSEEAKARQMQNGGRMV